MSLIQLVSQLPTTQLRSPPPTCTLLNIMCTHGDLIDQHRSEAFAQMLRTVGHRFKRVQLVIDWANKTHDPPPAAAARAEAAAHALLARLGAVGVLHASALSSSSSSNSRQLGGGSGSAEAGHEEEGSRGSRTVHVLRYATDAAAHARLLERAFNLTDATAPQLARLGTASGGEGSGGSSQQAQARLNQATCTKLLAISRATATLSKGSGAGGGGTGAAAAEAGPSQAAPPPQLLTLSSCLAMLDELPLGRRAMPMVYKTTFSLMYSASIVPRDCPLFFHADFPRIGRILLASNTPERTAVAALLGGGVGGGGVGVGGVFGGSDFVRLARHTLQLDARPYAVCLPFEAKVASFEARCAALPGAVGLHEVTLDGAPSASAAHAALCSYARRDVRQPHFSMQGFVADAARFRRAWPYPTSWAALHVEELLERSHSPRHFPIYLRANATPTVKTMCTSGGLKKLLLAARKEG